MAYSKKDCQKFIDQYKDLESTPKRMKDIFLHIVKAHPYSKCCIYFDEDDRKKSYRYKDFENRVHYLASKLSTLLKEMGENSLVALKLKNSPNWPLLFWALLASGHRVLLIDARLAHSNTENILKDTEAKAIIANEEDPYSVSSYRLNSIRNADDDPEYDSKTWGNEVLFCSSGTTGNIKVMVMDGENMCAQIAAAANIPEQSVTLMHPGFIRNMAIIPFHHIFGFVAVLLWFSFFGKTIVYPNSQSSSDMLKAIKKSRATHIFSVPMFWDSIAQQVNRTTEISKSQRKKDWMNQMIAFNCGENNDYGKFASSPLFKKLVQKNIFGTSVEYCISGGGYLLPKTARTINGLGYPLYDGFGMTEIGVISVERSKHVKSRLLCSIGKPFAGIEVKIDAKEGSKEGELLVKGAVVHKEEIIGGLRRKTVLEDGYFRTGDIATIEDDGRIYIKGRSKDTIISSNGENVYPDEIESYFVDVKHVNALAVFGLPHDGMENIILVLDLANDTSATDLPSIKEEIEKINSSLPNEKRVSEVYIYKKKFPISNNLKVKRFALKDNLKSKPSDFISIDEGKQEKKAVSFEGYDAEEVKDVISRIRGIWSKTLYLPDFKIEVDSSWASDLGGDSMSYIAMVDLLNNEFRISIPSESYGELLTIEDFAKEILDIKHVSPTD